MTSERDDAMTHARLAAIIEDRHGKIVGASKIARDISVPEWDRACFEPPIHAIGTPDTELDVEMVPARSGLLPLELRTGPIVRVELLGPAVARVKRTSRYRSAAANVAMHTEL